MNRKKLLAPILIGFCLMLALFPNVIVSQPLPEQTEYNPWCDLNDDGKIRVDDILNVTMRFGTDGNPAKPVIVTNWPDPMNVSVISPVDENKNVRVNGTCYSSAESGAEDVSWFKYLAQWDKLVGAVLVPEDLGDIGPERLQKTIATGYGDFSYTFHTLGRIDIDIAKKREILTRVTLSCSYGIFVENVTIEFGYTDKIDYTPLVSGNWVGYVGLDSTPGGYTIELGSLDSDTTITDRYLYLKVYVRLYSIDTYDGYYWFRNGVDKGLCCILVPYRLD